MKGIGSLRIVAIGAFISACASDPTTAPTNNVRNDLASVLREMTLPSLSSVSGALVGVAVPVPAVATPSNCTYSASAQGFQCTTVVAGGLTVVQSYSLLDAAGRSQSAFDANTTAAVRIKTSMIGTISADGSNLAVDQAQDMTLSGLLTSRHVMNGTSVMKMKGTVSAGGSASSIATTMNMTMSNLVMPAVTTGAVAYPLSGVITSDMIVSLDAGTPLSMRTEMTFNGTSKVAVVMTIGGRNQRCTIDLSNPASTCA